MCDFSTNQIPFYLNHTLAPVRPPIHDADVCFGEGGGGYLYVLLVCKCPQAPKTEEQKRNVYLHYAATVSSAPPSSCGWIAASWRWIWSIRSINRDYCNPRGQKEGSRPLRVHAPNAEALDKSVQEWQTCARPERKSLDPPHKDLFTISTFARILPTTRRAGAVKPHHL